VRPHRGASLLSVDAPIREWQMQFVRSWATVGTALAAVASASGARAEDAVAYRIESPTESVCPASREFATQLGARTPRARPAVGSEPALRFVVEVAAKSPPWVGRLTVQDLGGATTVREVPGASCQEVVSAMALIAAILVDPDASTEPWRPPPPAPAAPAARPTSPWWFGMGAGLGVESTPTPVPAAAVSVAAVLAQDRTAWFGLGLVHVPGVTVSRASGDGVFRWTAARASACALRWPGSGPVAARPCALLEAGALHAAGQRTVDRQQVDVPWLAGGLGLQLVATPVAPLALVLEGGVVIPWRRDRFYFDPDGNDNVAFRVPAVGLSARLGLVVHLL